MRNDINESGLEKSGPFFFCAKKIKKNQKKFKKRLDNAHHKVYTMYKDKERET